MMMMIDAKLIIALIIAFPLAASAVDNPLTPDATLTPGAWNDPPTPLDQLCHPGRTKQVRHVDQTLRNKVFLRYGIDPKMINHRDYEIDHLVSLELDGTNAIENLWPESYITQPLNAHTKDVLENTLHHMVCKHQITLNVAQRAIATDWVAAYHHYVLHD